MERAPSSNATPPPAGGPATVSRRGRRWGGAIAILVLAGIVGLAWYLTHRPALAPANGGAPGAAGTRGAYPRTDTRGDGGSARR